MAEENPDRLAVAEAPAAKPGKQQRRESSREASRAEDWRKDIFQLSRNLELGYVTLQEICKSYGLRQAGGYADMQNRLKELYSGRDPIGKGDGTGAPRRLQSTRNRKKTQPPLASSEEKWPQ
jgi:hypothetical protein